MPGVPGPAPQEILGRTHPALLREAIAVVGRSTDPGSLGTGSNLKVRWRCSSCEHEWVAAVAARVKAGRGCPQCAWLLRARSRAQAPVGRSLQDLHPAVAATFVRNLDREDMTPVDLRPASQQRCVWRCDRCGQEWSATVANRVNGRGCPPCANRRRAAGRRQPRRDGATAASRAPALVAEFLENLTNPGEGLERLRPASVDRCLWRCRTCGHEWQATVVNRVTQSSGCPPCAFERTAAARRVPKEGQSLAELSPEVAAEFQENLAVPGRGPELLASRSNDACRWRCGRGHEWVTTVASRAAGAGCARCQGSGRSLFEYQVAELLEGATGSAVRVDVHVEADGRRWRVDLQVVDVGLLVDLDPLYWHRAASRDERKSHAMRAHDYIRVRPCSLPPVVAPTVAVAEECEDPYVWAAALAPVLTARGLAWQGLTPFKQAAALAAAFDVWRAETSARPVPSAVDAAPALLEEFVGTAPARVCPWIGSARARRTSATGAVRRADTPGSPPWPPAPGWAPAARSAAGCARTRPPAPGPCPAWASRWLTCTRRSPPSSSTATATPPGRPPLSGRRATCAAPGAAAAVSMSTPPHRRGGSAGADVPRAAASAPAGRGQRRHRALLCATSIRRLPPNCWSALTGPA
ncbi:Probable Zinc-ribbon domain-containing protein [Geodermatophilus poikilotrophus]|uniref:Probable Zinc-ribbon domain-containing protein n=1 Tax=Geodermatophilus poikilotrophus TaxID=1333667 RepID=A0A1H9YDP1_9ACTN|nr:Probable Zinc-ribbon domain-containing protein [Geodermatophilus poikilotrophus]